MLRNLFITALVCLTLTACSNSPKAWHFQGGMTKTEATEILDQNNLNYTETNNEIQVEGQIEYLDQEWESMSISLNNEEKVDKVAFYHSDENSRISKYSISETLTKELGEESGGFGKLTTWSKKDKWMVSFADNEAPFPQALTYYYLEFMPEEENAE